MKEIILKRLGTCWAPYWIQMKYFEYLGIKDIIILDRKVVSISESVWREYRENPKWNKNLLVDKNYIHYKKVNKPNDHYQDYEYILKDNYNTIKQLERDLYFLDSKELQDKFHSCFLDKLDIEYDNEGKLRTDPFLINLVKEYQKTFPDGDSANDWFGKWCYNVIQIPDDVKYYIDEPEGCNECIREVHRIWNFNGKEVVSK